MMAKGACACVPVGSLKSAPWPTLAFLRLGMLTGIKALPVSSLISIQSVPLRGAVWSVCSVHGSLFLFLLPHLGGADLESRPQPSPAPVPCCVPFPSLQQQTCWAGLGPRWTR